MRTRAKTVLWGVLLWALAAASVSAQTYQYDAVGRLTRVAYAAGGGISYSYDDSDNLLAAMPLDLLPAPAIDEVTRLSPTEARITWGMLPGATGYKIERRAVGSNTWEQVAMLGGDATSYIDTTLQPGIDYVYRISALNDNGPSAYSAEQASQSLPTPAISQGGVVNAATYLADQLLAPGAIVTVFGADIGVEATEQGLAPFNAGAQSIPLPTTLGGYSLLIDQKEVPLFFVGGKAIEALERKDAKGAPAFAGQINAQVPWDVLIGGPVEVVVRRQVEGGVLDSNPAVVQFAPASPGIFEYPIGSGRAIVTNFSLGNDDVIAGSFAQAPGTIPDAVQSQPAAVGGIIIIWCMGLGPVFPEVEAGDAPGIDAPLSETVKPVRVLIGGVEAEIFGKPVLQATNVALYQINARVPIVEPGNDVPILIEVLNEDGSVLQSRSGVTIAVRSAPVP